MDDPERTARLVLASASAARLATLRAAGLEPRVVVSGVDESAVPEQESAAYVLALADLKASAVVARLRGGVTPEGWATPDRWVLGCDSVLELDGAVLGKPASVAEAVRRWRQMRGRAGVLHTGHCLVDLESGRQLSRAAATGVHFAAVTDAEIEAYVATGEPLQVAGAFTLDGLGGAFVTGIEGDPHNVVGLSLPLLREMFGEFGVAWPSLWASG